MSEEVVTRLTGGFWGQEGKTTVTSCNSYGMTWVAVSVQFSPVPGTVAVQVTERIFVGLLQQRQRPWSGYYLPKGERGRPVNVLCPQIAISRL